MSHPHPFEREVCEMLGDATMPTPVPLPTGEALATLAHELRDPLAAILLVLELHSGEGDIRICTFIARCRLCPINSF